MLRVKPDRGAAFISCVYPDFIEGNAPSFTADGLVLLTNYIGAREVKAGVPRYIIHRLILESRTLDEALKAAQNPHRAFSYHHIIASLKDNRAFSVETTPSRAEVKEIEGLYLHTNHLVLPSMKEIGQAEKYIRISSMPRLQSLEKNLGSQDDLSEIGADDIIKALSCHEGKPWSVCRHPEEGSPGATLCTALFGSPAGKKNRHHTMTLYKNNPCNNHRTDFTLN